MKRSGQVVCSQKGFVLASTLWVLAILGIVAGFFTLWVHNALEDAWIQTQEREQLLAIENTRAVLLYLLATQRMTFGGLTVPENDAHVQGRTVFRDAEAGTLRSELLLDNHAYKGVGKAVFAIQDEGGLLNLNGVSPVNLRNCLGLFGVPQQDRGPLVDKLLDYTDSDDLIRLNGAEAPDYKKKGLPPPANRLLLSVWEARRVMDWQMYPQLWENGAFPRMVTVASGGVPNLNTAPQQVLQTFPGVTESVAKKIIAARSISPFRNIRAVALAGGVAFQVEVLSVKWLPSPWQRIQIWSDGGRYMREIRLELNPASANTGPWLISDEFDVPVQAKKGREDAADTGISYFTSTVGAD
ncbi:MAG: hypothetical protein CSA33_04415 [Desulfobulbus propionicus]|nr:MAG: hypothetical protein CSA33_04415 [Desulfobulbus propionicus]